MIQNSFQSFFQRMWRTESSLRRQVALAAACVGLYALIVLEGPWGVHSLLQKHREIRQLEQQNAVLAQNNKRMREHVERLRTNPDERDLELRKKWKVRRPGETTFMLPEPKPEPPKK
jgi:cell division protein FtsB